MPQPDSSYIARSEVPAEGFRVRSEAGCSGTYSQRGSSVVMRCDGLLHSLIYTLCGMSTNASKVRPGVGPIESLQPNEIGIIVVAVVLGMYRAVDQKVASRSLAKCFSRARSVSLGTHNLRRPSL